MNVRRNPSLLCATIALFAFAGGCGSSDGPSPRDAAPDLPKPASDGPAALHDAPSPADAPAAADLGLTRLDAATPADTAPDVNLAGTDSALAGADGGKGVDGLAGETGALDGGTSRFDGGNAGLDARLATTDALGDAAPDGFTPGPATPVVVNSSSTATYNLGNGTWKVFYFDATASQLYCISELSGIARGYVSTSASVSPTNHLYATDSATGTLAFTATAAQRYYIAVAMSGGGGSGSFQVADGGQLLALGANTVTLSAPNADNYHFFRFPISAGHGYSISIAGPSTTSVGVGVSPRAERASNGQFQAALWGISGPLPLTNEAIPATSVALSYSGYYYFFVRVSTAVSITVTLTQTS